jgi:hypothetical protein
VSVGGEMARPKQGTDLYTVWFWVRHLEHLRGYATSTGLGDLADLHEDLREIQYEDAIAALGRIADASTRSEGSEAVATQDGSSSALGVGE